MFLPIFGDSDPAFQTLVVGSQRQIHASRFFLLTLPSSWSGGDAETATEGNYPSREAPPNHRPEAVPKRLSWKIRTCQVPENVNVKMISKSSTSIGRAYHLYERHMQTISTRGLVGILTTVSRILGVNNSANENCQTTTNGSAILVWSQSVLAC